MQDSDRTASLMTPAKLAQVRPKAPVSPAAWLDQMASDAGHAHVRRIADLQDDLRSHAQGQDFSSVAGELAAVAQALPLLDFGLLQPRGWWARTTGKGRGAGSEFAAQVERIEQALQALAAQNQLLRKKQLQMAGADRALLEVDVESRALEQIIDQGTRWLQDMRNQLKTRQSAGGDADARRQIDDDTARCELLVARLKLLRAIASAAQQVRQQAQETAARRAALMKMLQRALDSDVKEWRRDVSSLAASLEGSGPGRSLDAPMASHRDLQLCIKQAVADCAALQADEQALTEQLAALAGHLHAAP
jgi:DNA repair exonuclease SbcCD ATPase subunit